MNHHFRLPRRSRPRRLLFLTAIFAWLGIAAAQESPIAYSKFDETSGPTAGDSADFGPVGSLSHAFDPNADDPNGVKVLVLGFETARMCCSTATAR